MSLYMSIDKPSVASRTRTLTSRDQIGGASSSSTLNRVLPRNPKYSNIKSTLNTGANSGNIRQVVDRSGETFRRINRRQLHHLMLAIEKGDESIYELDETSGKAQWEDVEDTESETESVRSGRTVQSRAGSSASILSTSSTSSASAHPKIISHSSTVIAPSPTESTSNYYILLDVRESEQVYNHSHIRGAIHYPFHLLRRDYFPPLLYSLKNSPTQIIILYDSDETSRMVLDIATLFVQKDWRNIFVLTGGLKHFGEKYSNRIEGESIKNGVASSASSSANRSLSLAGTPASTRVNLNGSSGTMNGTANGNRRDPTSAASYSPSASASQSRLNTASLNNHNNNGRPLTNNHINNNFASSSSSPFISRPLTSSSSTTGIASQNHSATSLGFTTQLNSRRDVDRDEGMESPRAALARQQQYQQQQPPSSATSTRSQPRHQRELSSSSSISTSPSKVPHSKPFR